MRGSKLIIACSLILLPLQSLAHPVSYKGAVGVMAWNQPFLSDYWVTYSFHPRMAVAARAMRMEMPDNKEYIVAFPQFDVLAKRWNNENSQANVYLYGGAGGAKLDSKTGYAGQVGIEADAESRSWFIMGKWESMWATVDKPFYHGEFRLGAAPYEAEFDEVAAWLMVQYQYHPTLRKKMAITPLARLFYKSFLLEAGVSLQSDWMLNFMFHF